MPTPFAQNKPNPKLKKLLIISPYFAPINAADAHRVRTSISFYAENGWIPEVVAVDPRYCDMVRDDLLLKSIPQHIKIHHVKALNKRWTAKIGLGSIALRSLIFYFKAVNKLLQSRDYDLIFFSTTQFPTLALAAIWKKRFKTRIVFDIQDPWHSTYYLSKPKHERPKKFWFSYYLNKMLEPYAMQAADGLISVSAGYLEVLQQRYPHLRSKPMATIPFGMHLPDMEIAQQNKLTAHAMCLEGVCTPGAAVPHRISCFNLVYIGRGGHDLLPAFRHLRSAVQLGLKKYPEVFRKLKVHLYGTSYAPKGSGKSTFIQEQDAENLKGIFQETTDRLPYYQTLNTLKAADMLFIPGPDQADYVASKLYPYLMVQRPILAIVHPLSAVSTILRTIPQASVFHIHKDDAMKSSQITECLRDAILSLKSISVAEADTLRHYSAEHFTRLQTNLFDQVCQTPD